MTVLGHPLVPLVVLTATIAVARCALLWAGAAPSTRTEIVMEYDRLFVVLLWMDADARRLRRLPSYDFGFLARS